MRVIQKCASAAGKILGEQNGKPDADVRFLTYTLAKSCEEGILLFNVMTKELLLLEPTDLNGSECPVNPENPVLTELLPNISCDLFGYLFAHWYLVPEENDDRELCLNVRAIARHMHQVNTPKGFTDFTILTTTDCNARCFYCYEKGVKRQNMSRGTALKTLDFICQNYDSVQRNSRDSTKEKEVKLRWFGGEPLFNTEVIDLITSELSKRRIPYSSSMVSNGYLFDEDVIGRAVQLWKLKSIQITLDGTEEVYNQRKAYIYKDTSPFLRVMDNIGKILDAGIRVTIRLNMDDRNYEDLLILTDDLIRRFSNDKSLSIYPAILFRLDERDFNKLYNGEAEFLCERQLQIEERLSSAGLMRVRPLGKSIKINRCMADNDSSVMILPDGFLGKCEHDMDARICGDISAGITNQGIVDDWKQPGEDAKACETCPICPDCVRLLGCAAFNETACQQFLVMHRSRIRQYEQSMADCYEQTDIKE